MADMSVNAGGSKAVADQLAADEAELHAERADEQGRADDPSQNSVSAHPGTGDKPPPDPLAELKNDPEYMQQKKYLEILQKLEDGQQFYIIDHKYGDALGGGKDDGLIGRGDIAAAAADPNASPETRALAQEILDNPGVFRYLDEAGGKTNDYISAGTMQGKLAETKAKVEGMENAVLHPDSGTKPGDSPPPGNTTPSGSTTPPGNTTPTGSTQSGATGTGALDPASVTPRPAPSAATGLEGAEENAANMVSWSETEIDRLSAAYAAEPDATKQTQIKLQIDKLTRQAQSISAMENEISTMMSNLLKMYSDMAMTAIHNIH